MVPGHVHVLPMGCNGVYAIRQASTPLEVHTCGEPQGRIDCKWA